jgi:hypothetical protein
MTNSPHNWRFSWNGLGSVCVVLACSLLWAGMSAADSVDITLPVSVNFIVTDVGSSTAATVNPTQVSYANFDGLNLRMSIKADSAHFTRPVEAGGYIHANLISWTCSGSGPGGTTHNASLQDSSYTAVYDGTAASNSFDMTWSLSVITEAVHAGDHILTGTWKLESL